MFSKFWKIHLLKEGSGDQMNEFSEKIQTAFDPPPPHFQINYVANSLENVRGKNLYKGPKSET